MPNVNLPVKIIFFPGTHGHYVEFVLNTLATRTTIKSNPIDPGGTFHNATGTINYIKNRSFKCYHPGTKNHPKYLDPIQEINQDEFFIKIHFDAEEDVTVQQLALRRGPNISIDLESFTNDTYNKLMSMNCDDALEIIDNINQYSDITPYNNIKDASWPDISSVEDFWNLPEHIINECVNEFEIVPFYLDKNRTDIPRWVIRSMFKSWFYKSPPSKETEYADCNTQQFPKMYLLNLRNIYNVELFKQDLINIGNICNMDFDLKCFSEDTHQDYVAKVPNKDSKQLCNDVVDAVKNNKNLAIALNISEESYVEYLCEKHYNIKFSMFREKFFNDTDTLRKYIDNEI